MTSGSAVLGRHTAAPQFAGYLYQIQRTVLRLFDLDEGESVGVEVLDDLHVERDGAAVELGQSKHHQGARPTNLTDGSADLWKTLGTWAAAITAGELQLDGIQRLVLITTAAVPAGSIAEMVVSGGDVDDIIARIRAVPRPIPLALGRAHDAVMSLGGATGEGLRDLVARLTIHAGQPDLAAAAEQVRQVLKRGGFHRRTLDDAARRIEGWVWDTIITRLGEPSGALLGEGEFRTALCQVRDSLTEDTLPARFAEATVDEAEFLGQQSSTYIRQLALVGAAPAMMRRAVQNYFRATSERVRWVERGEILPERLRLFDRELVERWETEFEASREALGDGDDEPILQRSGLAHFRSIEQSEVPIQPGWIHRYLTGGSYHRLADTLQVGWHPHFLARLTPGPGTSAMGDNDD